LVVSFHRDNAEKNRTSDDRRRRSRKRLETIFFDPFFTICAHRLFMHSKLG